MATKKSTLKEQDQLRKKSVERHKQMEEVDNQMVESLIQELKQQKSKKPLLN